MEDTIDDSGDCSLGVDALVVPAGDELGNDPFKDLRGDLSSWFIEDLGLLACRSREAVASTYVREMILGQHGMCWISRMIIMEDNQLFVLATLDDF